MACALQVALIWLLVLVAVPIGSAPFEFVESAESCASWCPCDANEALSDAEHDSDCVDDEDSDDDCDEDSDDDCDADSDDDCDADCDGCCDARAPVMVGREGLPSTLRVAGLTSALPALDAPGCRVATSVFRPPRSLA